MSEIVAKCKVYLESSDGEIFEVDEDVASMSQIIKNMIEDLGIDHPMPLLNVSGNTLSKVINYCKHLVENHMENIEEVLIPKNEIEERNVEYDGIDFAILNNLILAANYMHIESLEDLTSEIVAKMITKKKYEDIKQIFNIQKDFINGEGAMIQRENQLLHFLVQRLPDQLQDKIKIKVGQSFHLGMWSAWKYDTSTRTLIVGLGRLHLTLEMDQQIAHILLHVDIGLVNSLVLQTGIKYSVSPIVTGQARAYWIEQLDLSLFKELVDFLDMCKLENVIIDDKTIDSDLENY